MEPSRYWVLLAISVVGIVICSLAPKHGVVEKIGGVIMLAPIFALLIVVLA